MNRSKSGQRTFVRIFLAYFSFCLLKKETEENHPRKETFYICTVPVANIQQPSTSPHGHMDNKSEYFLLLAFCMVLILHCNIDSFLNLAISGDLLSQHLQRSILEAAERKQLMLPAEHI